MAATAADVWLVGIGAFGALAFAALATAAAAVAAAVSARAARDTVDLLRQKRMPSDSAECRPMQQIRAILAEYTTTVPDGGEERPDAKALQRQVLIERKRSGLGDSCPRRSPFHGP
jgi:hypothetical protein